MRLHKGGERGGDERRKFKVKKVKIKRVNQELCSRGRNVAEITLNEGTPKVRVLRALWFDILFGFALCALRVDFCVEHYP